MSVGRVIPLRAALLNDSFWEAWQQMDERARTAYIVGEMEAIKMLGEKLTARVDEIEDTVANLHGEE